MVCDIHIVPLKRCQSAIVNKDRVNYYKMAKKNTQHNTLADPSRLSPVDVDAEKPIQVIIETSKGSRDKYAFDPKQKVFQLKKVFPAGMAFP